MGYRYVYEETKIDDDDDDIEQAKANNHKNTIETTTTSTKRRHKQLLYYQYLPVYLCAVAADWLQGPYKYSVYASYGYSQRDISFLFVAGFGSGMTLGSLVGGLADTWGRKRMVLVYCICYAISCLLKHCRPFGLLLSGRVLGGIATSLLYSVFDAWLIKAHSLRGVPNTYLSESFSVANVGSSIVAIVAGLVANAVVGNDKNHNDNIGGDGGTTMSTLRPFFAKSARQWFLQQEEVAKTVSAGSGEESDVLGLLPTTADDERWDVAWIYKGGGIAAFDLALIALALCYYLTWRKWDENYGEDEDMGTTDNNHHSSISPKNNINNTDRKGKRRTDKTNSGFLINNLRAATTTIIRSSPIFNLCCITSFFEGSMYIFILLWTPTLRALDVHPDIPEYSGPPLGLAFASFMVCCMLGASIFAIASRWDIRPSRFLVWVLLLSACSCLMMARALDDTTSYAAMLMYEGCIGAYYPAMSVMKSRVVPEDQRAAIYSIFRLPLNLVVLLNLFWNLPFQHAFAVCSAMLSLSTILQIRIVAWEGKSMLS